MSNKLLTPSLPLQVGSRDWTCILQGSKSATMGRKMCSQDPKSQPGMHFSQQQPNRWLNFQVSPQQATSSGWHIPTFQLCWGRKASVGWPKNLKNKLASKLGTCLYIIWKWNLFNVHSFEWIPQLATFHKTFHKRPRKASKYWIK